MRIVAMQIVAYLLNAYAVISNLVTGRILLAVALGSVFGLTEFLRIREKKRRENWLRDFRDGIVAIKNASSIQPHAACSRVRFNENIYSGQLPSK